MLKKYGMTFMALAFIACGCQNQPSEAVKYADAPIAQVPIGAVATPGTGGPEDFSDFKDKKTGCATSDQVKEKQAALEASGQPVKLQGAKDADCTVK